MQCGLCGDFNGEISDEFVGPNREVYKNAQRFGRSYQHTTEECARGMLMANMKEIPFYILLVYTWLFRNLKSQPRQFF